jgi:hypothetical protein
MIIERLQDELAEAKAELTAHYASWEFAFAMGSVCCGSEHPASWDIRSKTARLENRVRDLRAQLEEQTA